MVSHIMTLFLSFRKLSLLYFYFCWHGNLSISIVRDGDNGHISTSCVLNVGIDLCIYGALLLLGKEGFLGENTLKLFQVGVWL